MNAVYALNWAGASWKIRVGVLRLLSTIPGVTVADSTTGGRPTLTIASGPEVFGSFGTEVLIIDAETGLPISTASKIPGNPSGADYYRISRVTVASIKAGSSTAPGTRYPGPASPDLRPALPGGPHGRIVVLPASATAWARKCDSGCLASSYAAT